MALQDDVWQGKYAEDLVRALASAAGLTTAKRDLDVDGVDLNIGYPGRLGGVGFPCVDIQIKSWRAPVVRDSSFYYPLKVHNYDLLVGQAGIDFPVPRLLFLVTVPPNVDDYVQCRDSHYQFSHRAYWVSLMHLERPVGVKGTKVVTVPLSNSVTPETLVGLLRRQFDEEAA